MRKREAIAVPKSQPIGTEGAVLPGTVPSKVQGWMYVPSSRAHSHDPHALTSPSARVRSKHKAHAEAAAITLTPELRDHRQEGGETWA